MYYKITNNGYIIAIGTGNCGETITEAEYNTILNIVRNRPQAEEGFCYRLKADLTWELVALPPMPTPDEEATAEDYKAALAEVGV